MFATDDDIIAVAHVTKEFTLIDPLSEDEAYMLTTTAEASHISIMINATGRIISLGCDELETATALLSELGLIESIGKIREITEWDIVGLSQPYELEIDFTPEKGNDNGPSIA